MSKCRCAESGPRDTIIRRCRPQDKQHGRKYSKDEQRWCLWDRQKDEILFAAPTRKEVMGYEKEFANKPASEKATRTAVIKECNPGDKKSGRKYPKSKQNWCLWDSEGDDILFAGPTKESAEKQERSVQYHKHHGSIPRLAVNGRVYRLASIQMEGPGPLPRIITAAELHPEEKDQVRGMMKKIEKWLSDLVKYAHHLEDQEDHLLDRIKRKYKMVTTLVGKTSSVFEKAMENVGALFGSTNVVEGLYNFSDAYGEVGVELVEISNELETVVEERLKYAGYLKQLLQSTADMDEMSPMKIYVEEAAASLHVEEAV